ncbi:hypothetical protein IFM89_000039 [Coptis chinensis]|uniref:RRM domain-containing protein n=1 Tax=Coptis chinensis TaxID=261450 RepID=A0A835IM10_9MAGN|nr:hypothetical protein IFM89_000039 [Coptis chinensis]
MAVLDQTVQVLDLSPKVTLGDLNSFFLYCGTVEKILLERKEDQSQLAYVTFRQPFALQTALLLNGAFIMDNRVRILPLRSIESPPVSYNMHDRTKKNEKQGFIPIAHSIVQTMTSKGCENLSKAKEVLDQKYKMSEKGRAVTEQTRMAISATEQTVGRVGEVIVNNEHFSASALWVSTVLNKAAKCAAELCSQNKENDPNSRKQK